MNAHCTVCGHAELHNVPPIGLCRHPECSCDGAPSFHLEHRSHEVTLARVIQFQFTSPCSLIILREDGTMELWTTSVNNRWYKLNDIPVMESGSYQ